MDYRALIKEHEGFREFVYMDTEGVPTVGWGHAFFGSNRPILGTHFILRQCQELFEDDMQNVERDYCFLEGELNLRSLDFVRRSVVKNMLFNLGLRKLMGFRKMLLALGKGDYDKAAEEMLDSKWAKQVKGRAKMLVRMMALGKQYYA